MPIKTWHVEILIDEDDTSARAVLHADSPPTPRASDMPAAARRMSLSPRSATRWLPRGLCTRWPTPCWTPLRTTSRLSSTGRCT